MADIKLFRFSDAGVVELAPRTGIDEKSLHNLLEKNLESFMGIRFVAREHGTGRIQRGHIDSLGLDENNCPVIIEYKVSNNDNVSNQGLYYLNWLMDHKGDFCHLVRLRLGDEAARNIEFQGTRVICVAPDFSRYDEQAVLQIGRNVELVRYRYYDSDLILLELLNTAISPFEEDCSRSGEDCGENGQPNVGMPHALQERLRGMSGELEEIYLDLLAFAENLGEDVSIRFLKHYVAMVRFRNFASIQPLKSAIKLWLNLDPATVGLEEGFSRDVTGIGHHSTGNLEIDIHNRADLEKAMPFMELAYQRN